MIKTISISGIDVEFKSSGALPRLYKTLCNRDLFKDMQIMQELNEDTLMDSDMISVFENIAYCMAVHAQPKTKKTVEEWLEQFDMFGVVQALPEIVDMWIGETHSESTAKKNKEQ